MRPNGLVLMRLVYAHEALCIACIESRYNPVALPFYLLRHYMNLFLKITAKHIRHVIRYTFPFVITWNLRYIRTVIKIKQNWLTIRKLK